MHLKTGWPVLLWLACLSASMGMVATVVVLDRTTLSGLSKPWLASLVGCSTLAFLWWARPGVERGSIQLAGYEAVSLLRATAPLLLACLALVGASYLSEETHAYLFAHFHYRSLLSGRSWPVGFLAAAVIGYAGLWTLRDLLLRLGSGARLTQAAKATLAAMPALLPLGAVFLGLLLATASISTINVNFWRYWATADGWAVAGHYPSTFTDALHVEKGGVSRYFISFPLLPSLLFMGYSLLGHSTLASHLPLILGSTLLPLAVFLAARQVTQRPLLGFLFAALTASFPLLRNYTLDVAEADGLLMTMVILAAYFRANADRSGRGARTQIVAGVVAGLASLARPEGVLYMGAMYLASAAVRWRDRGFWLSAAVWGSVIAVFSAITLREFGMIWPGNHSGTIRLSNFFSTLDVVRQSGLFGQYAAALGLPEWGLAAIVAIVAVAVVLSGVRMLRRDFDLVWMPVAALGNVLMVFAVGPIPAEAGKFHDFFRHISYGFPLLAVTLAYGTNEVYRSLRGRWGRLLRAGLVLGLVALVLAELHLLAGPVTPGRNSSSPIMTSDVHVMATELLLNPYPLPVMQFRLSDGRYVPDAEEYMDGFPDDISGYYADADVRLVGNAAEYYRAAALLFLGFLAMGALSAAASPTPSASR